MATADELLATSDVLWINTETRQIEIPPSVKVLGVTSDDGVQKIKFAMPRYYNDIEFSPGYYMPYINYKTAKGLTGAYVASDARIVDDTVTFTWLVGRQVVMYPGTVGFSVDLKKTNQGYVITEFNTAIASLPVLESIEPNEQPFDEQKSDEYASIAYLAIQQALDTELKGDPGYTPVKGIDYYTDSEKEELVEEVVLNHNGIVANSFTGTAIGEVIRVDDVNPVEHTVKAKVSGENFANAIVTVCGKNVFDISTIADKKDQTVTGYGKYKLLIPNGTYTWSIKENNFLNSSCYALWTDDAAYDGAGIKGGFVYEWIGHSADESYNSLFGTFDVTRGFIYLSLAGGQFDSTFAGLLSTLQLELSDTVTEFEPYNGATYTPSAYGTCDVVSVAPTMTIFTDTAGVTVECEYGRDTNIAIDKLTSDFDSVLDAILVEQEAILAIQNALIGGV